LIAIYSIAIVGFGLWTSRLVRGSSEFFVAGRSLGAGLILSSMLAANIGAGATVNAAGLGYRDGLSAWWWSGSAGLASLVLAFWVGPRLWTLAKTHGQRYIELRGGLAPFTVLPHRQQIACWSKASQSRPTLAIGPKE